MENISLYLYPNKRAITLQLGMEEVFMTRSNLTKLIRDLQALHAQMESEE
jgi:hypothetical protein